MAWVYLATCEDCQPAERAFTTRTERDTWVVQHLTTTGHIVERRAEARDDEPSAPAPPAMADDVVDRMLARQNQVIGDSDREHMLTTRELFAELAEVVRAYDAEFRTKAYAAEHAFRPGQAIHTMAADCLACERIRHLRGVTL